MDKGKFLQNKGQSGQKLMRKGKRKIKNKNKK